MKATLKILVLLFVIASATPQVVAQNEIRMGGPEERVRPQWLKDLELAEEYYNKGEYEKALT